MKKVGFIGACDKTNLIMYVAKVLVSMDKKVLVVDATTEQKSKYIVPSINPTKSYVVEFEKIDFAIGFENFKEIKKYLAVKDEDLNKLAKEKGETNIELEDKSDERLPYDYALINIDNKQMIQSFEIENATKNYFVTTFDMYALRKGMDILSELSESLKLTKVLYSYDINREDEEYLNFISMEHKIIWSEITVYLPRTEEDNQIIEENQRVFKLRIKRLSAEYQDGIIFIAQDILGEKNSGKIRKSIKE